MLLKSLEIHGFKSFADKTKFSFADGITVIVGPNGSGKSNIADSIRWVLGEQSVKTLRGGKAEDIIFSGTNTRKPLGMAEVSLVLDNTKGIFPIAFSDIKVTRRLYRSGESEYLINDSPCRLKDIYDLFADSGLGKDALAIIGQGKIDEILSVRAEDRRGIVEEAAGITRYRLRKKEAERKLSETQKDLDRISDILHTLEERIDPLNEQKAKAEKFLLLDNELKELELKLLLQQLQDIRYKQVKLLEKISSQKEEFIKKETELRSLEAEIEQKKINLLKQEEIISNLQQDLLNVTSVWEKDQGSLKLNQEKIQFIKEKILNIDQNLETTSQEVIKINEDIYEISKNITEKEKILSTLKLRFRNASDAKIKHQQTIAELEKLLEEKKQQAFQIAQDLSNTKNQLQNNINIRDFHIQKIAAIQEKISIIQKEINHFETKIKINKENIENKNKFIQALLLEEENTKKFLAKLQDEQSISTKELFAKKNDVDSMHKQLSFYQEMERKHEGYGHAVQVLLGRRNQFSGRLHGTVAEVISVDIKYETAIETALGNAIQNLIVETEEDAKQAIEFLKKGNHGRATFLPINVIKGEKLKEKNNYLTASEVVQTKPEYKRIIEFLLGRTLISENLSSAIALAKETAYRYKIVTLDGDVIYPGGSLTGGSLPKKQAAFLTRRRLLEELEQKIIHEKEKINTLEEIISNISRNIRHAEEKLDSQSKLREKLTEETNACNTELVLAIQNQDSLKRELAERKDEERNLIEVYNTTINKVVILEKELEEKEKYYTEFLSSLSTINEDLSKLKEANENGQDNILEIKTELTRLETELQNDMMKLSLNEKQKNEKENLINKLNAERNNLISEGDNLENLKEELKVKILESASKKVELENKLMSEKERKQAFHMLCFEEEQKLKVLQKQLSNLTEQIHTQEVKLAKFETEESGLQEKHLVEFGGKFIEIEQEFEKSYAVSRAKVLQNEISSLGSVNIHAIEEYAEVIERFRFLSEQKEDLFAAKNSLMKVVAELEKEMGNKFLETFKAIDGEFQKVFQEMFGGGHAKLTLANEENILESGIDIIVQPPGKRLQHLMLLSGGEKALTAIALLFAVLRIKPAPFCVLDEIEAALDEVNVERFATFLKDYALKTQFIIISHRQGTMEVADTLYGTTIESGVTKLISVKFDDRMVG